MVEVFMFSELEKGVKKVYHGTRLIEQIEEHIKEVEAAQQRVQGYITELNNLTKEEQTTLPQLEANINNAMVNTSASEAKEHVNKAKGQLEVAKRIFNEMQNIINQQAPGIYKMAELLAKEKSTIDEIGDKAPTSKEERDKLIEEASACAKRAKEDADRAAPLFINAKERVQQQKLGLQKAVAEANNALSEAAKIQQLNTASQLGGANVLPMQQQYAKDQPSLQTLAGNTSTSNVEPKENRPSI